MSDQILRSYVDPDTGFPVELWRRRFPLSWRPAAFWFAYPNEDRNPFDGASGDTAAEAISKVLAKQPMQREAA